MFKLCHLHGRRWSPNVGPNLCLFKSDFRGRRDIASGLSHCLKLPSHPRLCDSCVSTSSCKRECKRLESPLPFSTDSYPVRVLRLVTILHGSEGISNSKLTQISELISILHRGRSSTTHSINIPDPSCPDGDVLNVGW